MSYVYMVSVRVSVDNDDRLDWTSPPTARSRLRRTEDRACVQGTYQTLCSVCLSVCSYCAKFTRPGFLELLQLYFSFTEGPALQSLADFDMVGHTPTRFRRRTSERPVIEKDLLRRLRELSHRIWTSLV